ncbi:hypothetical protein BAE44_0020909 [Dichanthelium oligosanthes]|uniref:No apical meristem-associated C-terminal domain-containing protein n=1 Tax=Dichanthelium oligosanthes TaxID=888268 RepID=A0A1E5UYX7_9POAL|nr:hypothetical protein BAE44_0020909 [Dichanthelium oligosanthes]
MDNAFGGLPYEAEPYADVTYTPPFEFTEDFDTSSQPAELTNEQVPLTDPVEVPPQGPSRSRKKGAVKKVAVRAKKFSVKEDELLCSACLNVTKDPIVGVNQPTGAYWASISSYFHEHKKTTEDRNISSLQHRWGGIQHETSQFCSFYAQVERKKESGKSEDDKVKDALQMYDGVARANFSYMHC